MYFMVNMLWVGATFFMQAIGNDVISIEIPKLHLNGTQTGEYLKVGQTDRHSYTRAAETETVKEGLWHYFECLSVLL